MSAKLRTAFYCGIVLAGLTSAAHAQYAMRELVGTPDASRPIGFDVFLPLRHADQLDTLMAELHNPQSPQYHKWLTPAQFAERFGPAKASMDRAVAALRKEGFAVTRHSRSLRAEGTPAAIEHAFGTHMQNARTQSGHIRAMATSALRMPSALSAEGASVLGLGGFEMRTMNRVLGKLPDGKADNRFSNTGTYYYDDLKQAYAYPAVNSTVVVNSKTVPFDGTGATLGVIMAGDVKNSDIKLLFDHENYSTVAKKPDPKLFKRVPINGGATFRGGATFEVALDVQQELTGAPGAHVILYNLPDLGEENILDGYIRIMEDNEVDLVSASFGICEQVYLPKYNGGTSFVPTLKIYHEIFVQGNAQGITFLASSGDEAGKACYSASYLNGGKAGTYEPGASSPASDPNVTAVGGTNVLTDYEPGTLESAYAGENAWSDPEAADDPFGIGAKVSGKVWGAGGGASVIFAQPDYQKLVNTKSTMRMVPDIGMQVGGCPNDATDYDAKLGLCNGGNSPRNGSGNTDRSAVVVAVGGSRYGLIGTSVSSPELAGALAMLIETKGRMGNLNKYIYGLARAQAKGGMRVFHTMIPGYDGVIQSNISPTYNVSTGVGTPIVNAFIGSTAPVAGTPQTPTNP